MFLCCSAHDTQQLLKMFLCMQSTTKLWWAQARAWSWWWCALIRSLLIGSVSHQRTVRRERVQSALGRTVEQFARVSPREQSTIHSSAFNPKQTFPRQPIPPLLSISEMVVVMSMFLRILPYFPVSVYCMLVSHRCDISTFLNNLMV